MQLSSSSHSKCLRPRGHVVAGHLQLLRASRCCCLPKQQTDSASSSTKSTLSALDSLLPDKSSTDLPASSSDGELQAWWKVPPRQSALPRQKGMTPVAGRFVMSEDFMRLGELRVGGKTQLDGQLELPKVQPIVSFFLFLLNVSSYGTFANVQAMQGHEDALDFLSGLWLTPDLVNSDTLTQLTRIITSTSIAPGPCELIITLWALSMVAPKAESVMGYSTFIAIYLLSGVTGGVVQLLALLEAATRPGAADIGACGAAAAVMGLVGCLAAHHTVNRGIEKQAASWRNQGTVSISDSPSSTSSSSPATPPPALHQAPTRQELRMRLLLIQSVCVAVGSLGFAGMQHIIGHPSDSWGGAGLWGEVALGMGVLPQLAGLGAGVLLGVGMGPRYTLQREIDIPEGSMVIPDDAQEMVVVMDRTTDWQRSGSALTYASFLLVSLAGLGAIYGV